MASNKQTESQLEQQNNNSDELQRTLSDSDIEALIDFCRLLDEWDRENAAR